MSADNEYLKECITPEGGLYDLGWYLDWDPHDDTATLDGSFSAKDLIAIGNYMLKNMVRVTADNDSERTPEERKA